MEEKMDMFIAEVETNTAKYARLFQTLSDANNWLENLEYTIRCDGVIAKEITCFQKEVEEEL